MQLTINGEARQCDALANLSALIEALGLDPRKVAIERNLEIVPRSTYAATPLADGDRIEIVHFIGGG
jgi:thiamine biosynthesis protein ThiS